VTPLSSIGAEACRQRRQPFLISLLAIGRSMLMLVAAWRQNSRDRRQLAAMSDRDLQDIGVCRGEVADGISRSFWPEIKGRMP
jgi:uncharacterized protein YjiS (DUF1127 family)